MPTKQEILNEVNATLRRKKLPEIEKIRINGPVKLGFPDLGMMIWIKGVANELGGSFNRTSNDRIIDIFTQPSQVFLKEPLKTSLDILCDFLYKTTGGVELEGWENLPD